MEQHSQTYGSCVMYIYKPNTKTIKKTRTRPAYTPVLPWNRYFMLLPSSVEAEALARGHRVLLNYIIIHYVFATHLILHLYPYLLKTQQILINQYFFGLPKALNLFQS